MKRVVVKRIDRKSSIETEPRTLDFRQIDIAREAALYVLNTRTMEEACQIFSEGMEPVVRMGKGGGMETYMDNYTEDEDESIVSNQRLRGRRLKDVLTAPF